MAKRKRSSTATVCLTPSRRLIITIDGPAGAGKSTTAKFISQRLGLSYLDTGATYRALAYAAGSLNYHPIADAQRIAAMARHLPISLRLKKDGVLRIVLGSKDISRQIRTEKISEAAALISQHPSVRQALVRRQRQLAGKRGVVVEGRDTGSVVFPRATHKFFLKADPLIRARRRQRELWQLYGIKLPLDRIHEQLEFRDCLDLSRKVGPLVQPKGSIPIDTSHLSIRQVVSRILGVVTGNRG
ncbi:MAG: (d)CMP kinase [Candidatus Omnitrophica bacterium]|nr:(d)CMP kinase [Candidatus Omnitrophota bacterium]